MKDIIVVRKGKHLKKKMTIEECFLEHKNFIYKKASSFFTQVYEPEEIISQAFLLFCKAYKAYDASKGYAFTTYLACAIINGLRQYFRDGNTLYYELLTNDAKDKNCEHIEEIDLVEDPIDNFKEIFERDYIERYIACVKRNHRAQISERNEEILRLYLNGYTIMNIARKYNMTHQRVNQIIRMYVNERYYNKYIANR